MSNKIPYFTFFRCKREYEKEHLNRIPWDQHDESLETEMASAYDRFFEKVRTEKNLSQVWLDGYIPSEDNENFIFVDWVGSSTGALSRWFNHRFETDVCDRDTCFIRLNFYDIIDLCNVCAKACDEDDYADIYGLNKARFARSIFLPSIAPRMTVASMVRLTAVNLWRH